ncbi:hypothetical protein AFLA70_61g004031, partial [Aspergillus flavus AF70]
GKHLSVARLEPSLGRHILGGNWKCLSLFHGGYLRGISLALGVSVTRQRQDKDGEKTTAKSIDFLGDIYVLEVPYLEPTTPDSWLCRIA